LDARLARVVTRTARQRAEAQQLEQNRSSEARALVSAAALYRAAGDLHAARAALQRAPGTGADATHVFFEAGVIEEYLGAFDHAAELYRAALVAEPLNYRARHSLVQLRKQTEAVNDIPELERQFRMGGDAAGWRTLHLGHALAKTCEDLGDLAKSFAWLTAAKSRRAAIAPYDLRREERLVDAAAQARPPSPARGTEAMAPIFVAGLPRSGTTLVDRILSSHLSVASAGEIGAFADLHKILSGARTAPTIDTETLAAEIVDAPRLGALYVEAARALVAAAPRFVDKAPSNYLLAKKILVALPDARVICVRRNPLDAVLSNYRQLFPIDDRFFDYVYGLQAAAHKVAQFERLMAIWREQLPPDRFMVLDYEALVAAQEPQTRALLAFCALAWDDRCLAFHENAAGVATPSARQVRQTMNAQAVGRAARYGALLDPAREVLARAGVMS
jgi:tetratricopeptide (TPR) repeat protein